MRTNNTTARAVVLTLAAAAALLAAPAPTQWAQEQGVEAEPRQLKLEVRQGKKRTGVKLFVERGALTRVTATDSAGTRDLKQIDKLAVPCAEEAKECKTVELESGVLVAVCYCKDTQTAILLPAPQKIREAGRKTQPSPSAGPHVKVFDGRTLDSSEGAGKKSPCWADEKLKLSICPQ